MAASKDTRNLYDRAVEAGVRATRPGKGRPKVNKPQGLIPNPLEGAINWGGRIRQGAQDELLRLAIGLDQNFGSDNSPQEAQRLANLVAELQSRDPGGISYTIGQGIGQSAAALPVLAGAAAALPGAAAGAGTAALSALANAGRAGKALAGIAGSAATVGAPAAAVEFLSGQPFKDETKRKEARFNNAVSAGAGAVAGDVGLRVAGKALRTGAAKLARPERMAALDAVAESTQLAKSFGITPRRPQFNPKRTSPLSEFSVSQSRQTTQEFAQAAQKEINKIAKPLAMSVGGGKGKLLPTTDRQGDRLVKTLQGTVKRTQDEFGAKFNKFEADIGLDTPVTLNNFRQTLEQFNVPTDSFLSFMKDIPYYQALSSRSLDMEGEALAIPFSEAKQLRGILHGRFKKYFADNGLPDNEASRNAKMLYGALARDTEEAVAPVLGERFADYQKLGKDYGDFKQNVEFFKKPIIDKATGGESFREFEKVIGSDAERFREIRSYMTPEDERIFKEATSTALYNRGRDGESFDPQRFFEDYSNFSPEMRNAISELGGDKSQLDTLTGVYSLFKDTGAFDAPVNTGPSAHHGVTRHRMLARSANAKGIGEAANFVRNIPYADLSRGAANAIAAQQSSPAARVIAGQTTASMGQSRDKVGDRFGDVGRVSPAGSFRAMMLQAPASAAQSEARPAPQKGSSFRDRMLMGK